MYMFFGYVLKRASIVLRNVNAVVYAVCCATAFIIVVPFVFFNDMYMLYRHILFSEYFLLATWVAFRKLMIIIVQNYYAIEETNQKKKLEILMFQYNNNDYYYYYGCCCEFIMILYCTHASSQTDKHNVQGSLFFFFCNSKKKLMMARATHRHRFHIYIYRILCMHIVLCFAIYYCRRCSLVFLAMFELICVAMM